MVFFGQSVLPRSLTTNLHKEQFITWLPHFSLIGQAKEAEKEEWGGGGVVGSGAIISASLVVGICLN